MRQFETFAFSPFLSHLVRNACVGNARMSATQAFPRARLNDHQAEELVAWVHERYLVGRAIAKW